MKAKTKRVVTAMLAVVMLLTTLLPLTASAADVTMDLNNCHVSWDYTLTDEDGNDIELEYVDALEHEGQTYMAFFPAVEDEADEESEDYGLVILKSVTENGEELLSTLDDEAELEKIYELFMEQLLADEEENS